MKTYISVVNPTVQASQIEKLVVSTVATMDDGSIVQVSSDAAIGDYLVTDTQGITTLIIKSDFELTHTIA